MLSEPDSQDLTIEQYQPQEREHLLEIAIQAWRPVFERMRDAVPGFVFDNFYPDGREARQLSDLAAVLDKQDERVAVAKRNDRVVGWACIRLHPEDRMGGHGGDRRRSRTRPSANDV
ncbi:hypothetical protein GCM10023190_09380 [Enteractinococcus fodinae]|uniref:N-acetyltransferase domain-containing protein n=1 Tax=Enteractinococcus fodinae TaxID=684663 RepID=A0ABU2AZL1_9MICC|nr:hypothetical protein [Enteractinococcus fodinae]